MENKKYIPIVLGTARKGRESEKVAKALFHCAKQMDNIETELIDVKDHMYGRTIPPWEENKITQPWRQIVARADGFIIVTPEYNHGYPGELKMLLDQELKAYIDKPVVLCGVSAGSFGGTRVVENLLPVMRELGLVASWYSIYVSNVKEFPDDLQTIPDDFKERVKKAVGHLVEMMG